MKGTTLISVILLLLATGCANQTTPTGGPKDEAPPVLISSIPAHNQKNFKGKNIELVFNEEIKLKDPREEILITPSPGKNTKYLARGKKVIIEPEFPWTDSTTYSIAFREGIQDITESNPAEDLRLAFSTGDTIDSLSINGTVALLFSEKIPEKITVALYQSDTFNIFNHTPTYFTKSNKKGQFTLQNLKAGNYYVYAFEDKNKNLKVESKSEKFGYLINPIQTETKTDSIAIKLITVDARALALTSVRHTIGTSLVRFNKSVDSIKVSLPDSQSAIYTFGDNRTELIFYKNFDKADSVQIQILASDSVNQKLDTTVYLKYTETKMASESFKVKEVNESFDPSTKKFSHTLSYNKLLKQINYDSIYIRIDSATRIPVRIKEFEFDTLTHTIKYSTFIDIPADSVPKHSKRKSEKPTLVYSKAALISIENDSSSFIQKEIPIVTEETTGMVTLEIETTEKDYFIEILSSDNKLVQSAKNVKTITFKYLKPQDYKIRVHIDRNKNKRWDPGNFNYKTEPEPILFYKSEEGKYTFPIRANWEVGPLVIKF
jgi:uncharacterized protein (DUF2141 family)